MTAATGNDAVTAHRLDYWTWVETHAVPSTRDALVRLRDHWTQVNETYFAGVMLLPYITLTEPSQPALYGQCCPVSSWGSRLEIRLRPSLLEGTHPRVHGPTEGCFRFVADVLTHEAIHQFDIEHQPGVDETAYHGHGPRFTEHCNRIGAALGLPEVVVRNRNGRRQPKAAQWPHCVRPAGYYLGAYTPPENVTPNGDTTQCPHCAGTGRIPREADQ